MKWLDRYLQIARIKKVFPYIKSGDHILDIGSSDGPLFMFLKEKKISFRGLGFDPEIEEEINEGNYRILKEMFPNDLMPEQKFDIITALAVLEHIPEDLLADFSNNCGKHLKEDGLLVITVPSRRVDLILKMLIGLRIVDGMEFEQHHGFNVALTIPLFSRGGFQLLRHQKFQLGLNNLFVFKRKSQDA